MGGVTRGKGVFFCNLGDSIIRLTIPAVPRSGGGGERERERERERESARDKVEEPRAAGWQIKAN